MRIVIFGASGSAGGSILRACLAAPPVTEVRAITRRPLPSHPKLQVFTHHDYQDYRPVEAAFAGVDACLFCLGISVTQVANEAEYRTITHDFTIAAARALQANSRGAAFHYISGRGTRIDSRMMWARVKGATERELMDLVGAVCWRPAAIDGLPSASEPRVFRAVRPAFKLLRPFRSLYVTGEDFGRAMLQATAERMRSRIVESAEIRDIADRAASFRPPSDSHAAAIGVQ